MSVVSEQSVLGLAGSRTIVVGAGPGIGREIALALGAAGASVLCADVDGAAAEQTTAEIAAAGGIAYPFVGDLLVRSEVEAMVDRAKKVLGGIDLLADVLGRAVHGSLLEIGDDDWDDGFAINVSQGFRVTQVVGRELVAQGTGGAIVHIASINALGGQAGNGACAAAKAALVSMVKTAGLELGPAGIRVNAIAPGAIDTPRLRASVDPSYWSEVIQSIPLGRAGTAEDVAGAALFLLSDLARYVTAQTLVVDGGVTARFPIPMPGSVETASSNAAS